MTSRMFFMVYSWYNNIIMLGSKGILPPDATDFSALRAPKILKTFEIRPNRATVSCFTGPKVIQLHASMHCMTFWPWHHIIILINSLQKVYKEIGLALFNQFQNIFCSHVWVEFSVDEYVGGGPALFQAWPCLYTYFAVFWDAVFLGLKFPV